MIDKKKTIKDLKKVTKDAGEFKAIIRTLMAVVVIAFCAANPLLLY